MTPVHAAVLDRARKHLTPDGEAWLVLSGVAGHLGLRTRGELPGRIAAAGPHVAERTETRPRSAGSVHSGRTAAMT